MVAFFSLMNGEEPRLNKPQRTAPPSPSKIACAPTLLRTCWRQFEDFDILSSTNLRRSQLLVRNPTTAYSDNETIGILIRTSQFGLRSATSIAQAAEPKPHSRILFGLVMGGNTSRPSNSLSKTPCIMFKRSISSWWSRQSESGHKWLTILMEAW